MKIHSKSTLSEAPKFGTQFFTTKQEFSRIFLWNFHRRTRHSERLIILGLKIMASNDPNYDGMKVAELKRVLIDFGASLSGNKETLVKRAKLYHKKGEENPSNNLTTVNEISEEIKILQEKRKIFDQDHEYHEMDPNSTYAHLVPEAFVNNTIVQYLTSWRLFVNQEEVDGGTGKPAVKGPQMFKDKLIQFVQFSEDNVLDLVIFRANINASMAQELQ